MTPDLRLAGWRVCPHPDAPLFDGPDGASLLAQAWNALGHLSTSSAETREILRQAGLVNLWFFLRGLLALGDGPYNELNDGLHREMANFCQLVTKPGARLGLSLPRSTFKSTIGTHGADTWLLVRDPNLRIGISSCIVDKAIEFYEAVCTNLTANEVLTWLYPEVRASYTGKRLILENRTRAYAEPSLKYIASGASTAGNHFDHLSSDDIVGDAQLNADRSANAEMYKIKNWFQSNSKSLLISMSKSTILLAFTRYAIDDAYDWICDWPSDAYGYWDEPPKLGGEYAIYYRAALENGESILPEKYTTEQLEQMLATDPWTAQTQYMNNPRIAGLNEFLTYRLGSVEADYDADRHTWILHVASPEGTHDVALDHCDVVLAVDPAGSDKRITEKTSRSAIVVAARDARGNTYLLDAYADWAPTTRVWDKLFAMHKTWKPRVTRYEMHGGFQTLKSLLAREQLQRKHWLNLSTISPLGDKLQTIRDIIQPVLERGCVYATKKAAAVLEPELRTFPTSRRLDALDALKIALQGLRTPEGTDDEADDDVARPSLRRTINATVGY